MLSVCLCAIVAFVSTAGTTLYDPPSALAASGTLTVETPLHQDPSHGAPMVALLGQGTMVTIDGPPIDGFYPVTAGNLTGWMRGETLSVIKDVPVETVAAEPTSDATGASTATAQEALDPALSGQPADASAGSATSPVAAAPPADPATGTQPPADNPPANDQTAAAAPAATLATQEPVPGTTDPAAAGTASPDPAQTGTAPPPPADTPPVAAEPASTPSAPSAETPPPASEVAATALGSSEGAVSAPAESEPVSTPDPNVTPVPMAVTGPEGPATAAADLPIRVGPGTDYDRITLAPSGSTVYQTGHVIDGFVSVQFDGITGWAELDHLSGSGASAPPADAPAAETPVASEPLSTDDSTPAAPTETDDVEKPHRDKDKRDSENDGDGGDGGDDPANTPAPTPEPNPWGPASVLVNTPVYAGPSPDSGLIFTVPQGSTLEKTGEITDGYVSVRYKEVYGWAALEHLAEPIEFVEETLPEDIDDPVDTREPKPGSGVAYTTVDLSLRAGPSAEEEPIVVVPAGSRVELTGVMEGNFQRVTYEDEIGWIANDYLANPDAPRPNDERKNDRKHYTEREIIKIIHRAAKRYDQPKDDMVRVARCESNLDPYAVNPSGSYGLFQFIRSTWESTPYGDEDIFDPEANANAAAWMWDQGRKSEWVCQ